MRIWIMFFLLISLGACASREVHCDGRLTAINPAHGGAAVRPGSSGRAP